MSTSYLAFPKFDPVIFSIGPVSLHWYGLMYLVGFVFAMWLAVRRANKPGSGWTKDEVENMLYAGFLGVFIGGRVGYVLFYNLPLFLDNPLYLFKVWDGGMSFHGGLIGVIAVMLWFARRTKRNFFQVSDFIAPLIPFGLGAGRLGNFINGELWGVSPPTHLGRCCSQARVRKTSPSLPPILNCCRCSMNMACCHVIRRSCMKWCWKASCCLSF